jgi:hypothetical protein
VLVVPPAPPESEPPTPDAPPWLDDWTHSPSSQTSPELHVPFGWQSQFSEPSHVGSSACSHAHDATTATTTQAGADDEAIRAIIVRQQWTGHRNCVLARAPACDAA